MKKLTLFMSLLLLALVGMKANAATYTVAGSSTDLFGTAWTPSNTANDMTLQGDGSYTLVKENVALAKQDVEFKVCVDHGWSTAYPSNNYKLSIPEMGTYDVTFKFEPNNNNNVSATAVKKGSAQIETFYYLVGAFNGWAQKDENYKFTNEADGTHLLENVDLAAGGFKFIDSNGSWYGDGATVPAAGGQITVSGNNGDDNNLATGGNYTVLLDLDNNKAVFTLNEEEPLVIESMSVLGDEALFGDNWVDHDMTQNGAIWTYTIESVVLSAGNYEYKARANHTWDSYQLPAVDNNVLVIEEAGEYKIDFIANTENHTLTAAAEKVADPVISITAVDLMGSSTEWVEPLASFVVENASTGYWEANDIQFAANDEFKIRVSYSDQSVKWYVPVTESNFLVDEEQLNKELTLTDEGGFNNMYVEQDATLSFSLAPGFGKLVITGEFVQPEPAFTLHHGHDGQNDWQTVAMTAEDGIFTAADVEFTEGEVFYFTDENDNYYPNEEAANDLIFVVHSGYCTDIDLYGAGCHFFQMNEASTFTIVLDASNPTVAPTFNVTGWPSHDIEMYLFGNIEGGSWENGTLMDVLESNSHWLKYFTVEDVNNGNGYLKLGKAATFSDDTAIGAVDDADNYEVIAESADALRALQIPMVDGGKAIEIAAGFYAMHVWYNAETGEGRVQFDPQNVPIGKVEILVPDDGLVIEQGQTLQLEAVYTPQYTTNADLTINWLSSDPSIATVDENGLVTALAPEANGAPRRAPSKNADNTVTITASMENNDGSIIDGTIDITVSEPTGINDLVVDANVASVKYINAMGQMSDRAFDGLNIVVTTYIDGTTSTVKVVK